MRLGEILVGAGHITPNDLEMALERQNRLGGRLGEHLVALQMVDEAALQAILSSVPSAPGTIAETGLPLSDLLRLFMKAAVMGGLETPSRLAQFLKLPSNVIAKVIDDAVNRKYLEIMGQNVGGGLTELRFSPTQAGRGYAAEAYEQNQYVGAAPVSLASYHERIHRQKITNERVDGEKLTQAFSDIIITDDFVRRLGPAVNSGRSILLYGPPGNGKTTIAEKLAEIFDDVVYIPYALQVEGQIIKIFDPSVHTPVADPDDVEPTQPKSLRKEDFDRRWVPCKRPIVVTGGELTLEMLDLSFNTHSRFYEAPLHVKALSGTFIIDDFGRQIVSPEMLLNRWIVPLQSRIDYLKLHTGKSFSVPFDELVIFSTNLSPADLMDPAFLRRIPYKLETMGPSAENFVRIFQRVAETAGLKVDEEIIAVVLQELQVKIKKPLACYQPKFIIDQVVSTCKYEGKPPAFTKESVLDALSNLYVHTTGEPAETKGRPVAAA
ncbi:MAG: hypothetical protein ACREDZ_14710 [Kiloniellales bacterium]